MQAKRAALAPFGASACLSGCLCLRCVAPRTVLIAQASSVRATALLMEPPTFVMDGIVV